MAKDRTTLILTFEHDSTHTAHRPKFVRYATDIIRILNTYPALGVLKYAGVMQAGAWNSLGSLNAQASGPLQAEAPQTFRQCDACVNIIHCQNEGGCIIQKRAVAAALVKRDAIEAEPHRKHPVPPRPAVNFDLPARPAHRPGETLPRQKASKPKASPPPKSPPPKKAPARKVTSKKPAAKKGSKKR